MPTRAIRRPPDGTSAAAPPIALAVLLVLGLLGASPATLAAAGCARPSREAGGLVAGINEHREANGLPRLAWSSALCRVAEERAEEMARRDTVWRVEEEVAARRLSRAGYVPRRWAERVAQGRASASTLLVRWASSTLGDYEDVAVAARESAHGPIHVLLLGLSRRSADLRRAAPFADVGAIRGAVLDEVNAARERRGRRALRVDPRLERAAQRYAEQMVDRGFYGHESPEGAGPRDRAEAVGYVRARVISENLARGLVTPAEIVDLWLASPGHRRNILDETHRDTGVGFAVVALPGGGVDVYWVQLFGTPRSTD